jgi:hypothetical protein
MRKYLLLYFLMLVTGNLLAQTISVSAPSHVALGENFRIAYTVNTQDVGDFRAGNIPSSLEIIAGPYTSSQSSFQMINGHTSSSSSVTYTYTLYAGKDGTFTIPAAHARIGNKTISSRSVKITVSGSGADGEPGDQRGIHQIQHADDGRQSHLPCGRWQYL